MDKQREVKPQMRATALCSAVTFDKGPLKESASYAEAPYLRTRTPPRIAGETKQQEQSRRKMTSVAALYTQQLCSVGLFVAVANGRGTS